MRANGVAQSCWRVLPLPGSQWWRLRSIDRVDAGHLAAAGLFKSLSFLVQHMIVVSLAEANRRRWLRDRIALPP
jgi:hypothetical protein